MPISGRRAVVTGGAGFIGSHLVDVLLAAGYEVTVLDNFATGSREHLLDTADHIALVEGDIQSYERVHNAIRDAEVVFHLAALPSVPRSVQDPLTSHAVNVVGTLNVLLVARDAGVKRVVFASSSSLYGTSEELPKHEGMRAEPIAPYGVSKLAAEGYCRSFTHVYGLETVALRYFNVFGPRQDPLSQYSAVIPRFISSAREGRSPVIYGDGEQSRDFTYVENAVRATLLAADAPAAVGGVFNVACGRRVTLNEIVGQLSDLVGRRLDPVMRPARGGDVRHSLADISRAEDALGYRPEIDFDTGFRLTFDYHEHSEGQVSSRQDTLS